MQIDRITVGLTAVKIPLTSPPSFVNGLRLLCRAANAGNVFVGLSSSITTTSGTNLVPKGAPETSQLYTIPAEYIAAGGQVWLIADTASQLVDWSAA